MTKPEERQRERQVNRRFFLHSDFSHYIQIVKGITVNTVFILHTMMHILNVITTNTVHNIKISGLVTFTNLYLTTSLFRTALSCPHLPKYGPSQGDPLAKRLEPH